MSGESGQVMDCPKCLARSEPGTAVSGESGQVMDCPKCLARAEPRLRWCGPGHRVRPWCKEGEHIHRSCATCDYTDLIPCMDSTANEGALPA